MSNLLGTMFWAMAARAAHAYVAGPALSDAVRVCHALADRGFATTICRWNAAEDSPEDNSGGYLAAIAAIAADRLACSLSLKLPDLRFSPSLLAGIVEAAGRHQVVLHFDSLGPETAEPTFALIRRCLPADGSFGCTLPGRWRRSLVDADQAVALGLNVRVVKGQWPADPGLDPRLGFLRVVDRLAGRARHVAVATHDPALARQALTRLRAAGTPACLELLFGLPFRQPLAIAGREGFPVRFYVPYGRAWLPYAAAQAARKPHMLWWMLRDLCAGSGRRLPASR